MRNILRLLKWSMATAMIIFGIAAPADEHGPKQLDLFEHLESPSIQPVCDDLTPTFHPNWTGALWELNGKTEAPFFAKASASEAILTDDVKARMKEAGFWVQFSPDGFVELRKDGHIKRVPMSEPIHSVEFFQPPVAMDEFPDDDAFLVIVGWTQVNYYRYTSSRWLPSNESFFAREIRGVTVAALKPYHVKVEPADRDEVTVLDPNNNKLYYNRKQFRNLLDQLHLNSKEELENFAFVNRMRSPDPRAHLLSLYLESLRLGDQPPSPVAQIFTQAALDIAQFRNPNFTHFFSPLVRRTFEIAFKPDNYNRFVAHFADVVKTVSKDTLTLVPLGEVKATSDGEPMMRFKGKNGREYIVYYLFSSLTPLRIVAVGS